MYLAKTALSTHEAPQQARGPVDIACVEHGSV